MLLKENKLKVLEKFSENKVNRLYGRDIAKKLKMNQKTVANSLNELEKENILSFKLEGKNKYYFFNKSYPYLKEIIKLIEIKKKIG